MRIHRLTVLAGAVLFCNFTLSGCTMFQSQTHPTWINGESLEFPSNRYLIGVGEGNSRMVAEERAYAAVARIFEAQVETLAQDSETYSIAEQEGTSRTSRQLTLDHVTRVSTKKVLENVKVLDRWDDLQEERYFVLAGMDRIQSEKSLLEELSQLDQVIEKEVTESRAADDTLTKIRRLKRALNNLKLREAGNADLRIIRLSGSGQSPPYHWEDLKNELDQHLRHNFNIRLQIQGEQAPLIRRALFEGLTREGFLSVKYSQDLEASYVTENSLPQDRADLIIQGKGRMWKADLPDPLFVYVRWCTDLLVIDDKPQRIIGVVSRSGREGHITPQEAFARASKAMQAAVTTDVANKLSDFIYGEIQELTPPSKTACPR